MGGQRSQVAGREAGERMKERKRVTCRRTDVEFPLLCCVLDLVSLTCFFLLFYDTRVAQDSTI